MECPHCHRQECSLCPHCHQRCGRCHHCHARPIPPRNRLYCERCSTEASRNWKRRFRDECRSKGVSYRYEWKDDERRRAYHREYMRRWRARGRASPEGESGSGRVRVAGEWENRGRIAPRGTTLELAARATASGAAA